MQSPDETSETNLVIETALSFKYLLEMLFCAFTLKTEILLTLKLFAIAKDLIQSIGFEQIISLMSMTGFHRANSINCLKLQVKVEPADEISDTVKKTSSYSDLLFGTFDYNVINLSKRCPHLLGIRRKRRT